MSEIKERRKRYTSIVWSDYGKLCQAVRTDRGVLQALSRLHCSLVDKFKAEGVSIKTGASIEGDFLHMIPYFIINPSSAAMDCIEQLEIQYQKGRKK